MARPLRIEFEGAWHHVMNRGAGRKIVFRSLKHRKIFLGLLRDISSTYRLEVHAYCLMDNHYHLLVRTPEAGLGRAMRHLDGVYTQRFNRDVETDGALFRGRYQAALIDADAYLLRVSRYVHLNPVDAGIVRRPEDYPHSSYRGYLASRSAPKWLQTSAILDLFGKNDPRKSYRGFVEGGVDKTTRSFYPDSRLPTVVGNEEFQEWVQSWLVAGDCVDHPEMPETRRVGNVVDFETIGDAVCRAFNVAESELRQLSPEPGRESAKARAAFVYLARLNGGHRLDKIAAWLGYRRYGSAAGALHRLRRDLERDSSLRRRFDAARQDLIKEKT
jgi:REP element-mobilizing transposase RayT